MTLETLEAPPVDLSRLIGWHLRRAILFHDEARRLAQEADGLRRKWQLAVGVRQDTPDIHAANRNCRNHSLYKDLCSDQAMYDRWATREYAAATALTTALTALQTKGH
jgi:hypothetical protein